LELWPKLTRWNLIVINVKSCYLGSKESTVQVQDERKFGLEAISMKKMPVFFSLQTQYELPTSTGRRPFVEKVFVISLLCANYIHHLI
jgi:hypothetical protein